QVICDGRKVCVDPLAVTRRDETVKRRGQPLQSDRSNVLAVDRARHGLTESRVVEPCAFDGIYYRAAIQFALIEVEPEMVGLESRTEIGDLCYSRLRSQLHIVRWAEAIVDVQRTLLQSRQGGVRVLHHFTPQLTQVGQRIARLVFFPVVRVTF